MGDECKCSSCGEHLKFLKNNGDADFKPLQKLTIPGSPDLVLEEVGLSSVTNTVCVIVYRDIRKIRLTSAAAVVWTLMRMTLPRHVPHIGQYLQLIVKSSARRPSSTKTLRSLSTFEALIALHSILIVNYIIATERLAVPVRILRGW